MYQFVVDLSKCVGCSACSLACKVENKLSAGVSWRTVFTFNQSENTRLIKYYLPLACNHCEEPACMAACPCDAYSRDEETGAIILDSNVCMGCGYCAWACPYDAPQLNPSTGVMEKCTFCNHKMKHGALPACVEACPTNALRVEEINSPSPPSDVPGFPNQGLKPKIRFLETRYTHTSFQERSGTTQSLVEPPIPVPTPKVVLRHEWPLFVFTSVAIGVVSLSIVSLFDHSILNALVLLTGGVLGLLVSFFHLGKKSKALGGSRNIQTSWLSREVSLYPLFLLLTGISFLFDTVPALLTLFTLLVGLGVFLTIDMLYLLPNRLWKAQNHIFSFASVSGLYIIAFVSFQELSSFLLTTRLLIYFFKLFLLHKSNSHVQPSLIFLRLLAGFIFPMLLLLYTPPPTFFLISLTSVLLGELVERLELYIHLDYLSVPMEIFKTESFLLGACSE